MVKLVEYYDIINEKLINDAYINNGFPGFREDYLVVHCLLKQWMPKNIFEIGTANGVGCRVIKSATPNTKIITLDINTGPTFGEHCPIDTTILVGDSMTFDFAKYYPIECWFIDGDHVYDNVYHETKEAIKSNSKYIIYHDADIPEVYDGIIDAHSEGKYELFQVINPPYIYSSHGKCVTRVLYAIKK